jgi:3-phenylpropionate/cinnamic acid dioxygenase small subunit
MTPGYVAITHLLYTYAERIDQGDFDGVADLFTHAFITVEGTTTRNTGKDEIREMYTASTRRYEDDGTPHTKHVITNPIIEVDEDTGTARSRSYFTVFQQVDDFPLQPVIAGRYRDEFERAGGEWRFTHRHMICDLFGDLSRHLLFDATAGLPDM